MLLIGHLRAIRVLCMVEDSGSFSAAARDLGMTQSAVSQHVATLEGVVGAPLVLRGTRPLELTQAGAALLRHGRAILAELDHAEQSLGELTGRLAGRLRLGSFPTALEAFVGDALVRLRRESPDLVLTVVDDHMQRLVPRLTDGELDLAIVYEHPALPADALGSAPRSFLFDDPFRVLLPAAHHRAADQGPLPLGALAGEPWIGGRAGSAWFRIVAHACRSAGFEPSTILTTDDYRAVQAFVAAGLGVAVVPGLAAANALPGIVVREAAGAPARRVCVARLPGAPALPAVRLMTDILVDVTTRFRAVGDLRSLPSPAFRAGSRRRA